MEPLKLVPRTLAYVGRPSGFRRATAVVLRILAAALALGQILPWINLWRLVDDLDALAILGLVIYQVVSVVTVVAIVHTVLIRATDVLQLSDSDLPFLSVMIVLCRLAGECFAWLFGATGIGGGLLLLLARSSAWRVLGDVPLPDMFTSGTGLLAAPLFAAGALFMAFVALVGSYALADALTARSLVARNSERIRARFEQGLAVS